MWVFQLLSIINNLRDFLAIAVLQLDSFDSSQIDCFLFCFLSGWIIAVCLCAVQIPILSLDSSTRFRFYPLTWIIPITRGGWVEGVRRIMRAWVGPGAVSKAQRGGSACAVKPLNSLHPHWHPLTGITPHITFVTMCVKLYRFYNRHNCNSSSHMIINFRVWVV